jgi:hypothetical protein
MLLDEDDIFEDIPDDASEDNPEELVFSEDDDIAAIDLITDDDVADVEEIPLDNLDEGDKDEIHT